MLADSSWPPDPATTFTTNIAGDDFEDLMAVWKRLCKWSPHEDPSLLAASLDRISRGEGLTYSNAAKYPATPPSNGLAIVIESFKLFPHMAKAQIGSDFPSCQVIGQLKLLAYQTGLQTCLHFQNPDLQTMWPTAKLKKLGFMFSGMTAHETSALKHAVHYCRLIQPPPSRPTITKPKG